MLRRYRSFSTLKKIPYAESLDTLRRNIDPVALNRQFCDVGTLYRSGIYYHNPAQEKAAKQSQQQLVKSKPFRGAIVTEMLPASIFYPADDYHRDYYQKNPLRYKFFIVTVAAAING